jgi:hypothetical protein
MAEMTLNDSPHPYVSDAMRRRAALTVCELASAPHRREALCMLGLISDKNGPWELVQTGAPDRLSDREAYREPVS